MRLRRAGLSLIKVLATTGMTAILANGWTGYYISPPTDFTPTGPAETITILRPGFDASCAPTILTETLTLMKRVRLSSPSQASKTANDVALSDHVYQGEFILGAINNSTRVAPTPVCLWMDHDLQRAVGQSITVRLAVAHLHARNGSPVAAVKFIATDGTTTVTSIVSGMTLKSYSASGLQAPVYEATLNLATLTANVMVTIDAEIYPWVGAMYKASVNGAAYPSINFTTMRVLNDNGSYGTAYAYVDATLGNNGTAVTSATAATAAALPYATVAAAASAIQTFNNANYSRNNTAGGIIRLVAGTYTHASFSAAVSGPIPLVIEAANPANKATTIYQDAGAHVFNGIPQAVKFKDLTIRRNSASNFVFLDASSGGTQTRLILENCTNDDGGFGAGTYGGYIDEVSFVWVINCDGAELGFGLQQGTDRKQLNVLGSTHSLGAVTYNFTACKVLDAVITDASSVGNREVSSGRFVGFNYLSGTGNVIFQHDNTIGPAGLAFVGNIVEARSTTQPAVQISGGTNPSENVIMQSNTIVGARSIIQYNDIGSAAVLKYGAPRFTVFDEYNTKTDTFPTANGNRIGNWSVIYKVGARANALLYGDTQNDVFGIGEWAGEVAALGDVIGTNATPIVADWTSDRSSRGTAAGNGNYKPGGSTALPFIPAGLAPYAYDLYGAAVPNNGTGRVGAVMA